MTRKEAFLEKVAKSFGDRYVELECNEEREDTPENSIMFGSRMKYYVKQIGVLGITVDALVCELILMSEFNSHIMSFSHDDIKSYSMKKDRCTIELNDRTIKISVFCPECHNPL